MTSPNPPDPALADLLRRLSESIQRLVEAAARQGAPDPGEIRRAREAVERALGDLVRRLEGNGD